MKEIIFHKSQLLDEIGCVAGYFERTGGVSKKPYNSLNTKKSKLVQDSTENVAKNIILAMDSQGVTDGALLQLEGGANVFAVSEINSGLSTVYEHDGVASNRRDFALMLTVADCYPVWFADRNSDVIGIAHCGWKGVNGQIINKTVKTMRSLGASNNGIVVSVGPGICSECYEVKRDVADLFDSKYIERKGRRMFLDLKTAISDQLGAENIHNIEYSDVCTYENTDRLFSARKENVTGRFLTLIMRHSA